jgi:hypothetical protein
MTRRALLVAAVLTVCPGSIRGDIGNRQTVLVPQLVVPLGELSDVAGTGAGIGVEWNRPIDPDLSLVTTIGSIGFRRRTNPDALLVLDGLVAVGDDREVTTRSEVVAVPVLVGVKYSTPEFFIGASIGDLFTRVETTTVLRAGATERTAGSHSRTRHGPLVSLSAGVERGDVSFTGLRLGYAPGSRGPGGGASNFTWITIFIAL